MQAIPLLLLLFIPAAAELDDTKDRATRFTELRGAGGPQWLINPLRESLTSSGDVDEYLVVHKAGQAVHVQASGATPFAPQIELWDGAGNLIGADYPQAGDTHSAITMPPGVTVTNILHLYVSGAASAYPAYYTAWKGAP
jgi:hypothetical protein